MISPVTCKSKRTGFGAFAFARYAPEEIDFESLSGDGWERLLRERLQFADKCDDGEDEIDDLYPDNEWPPRRRRFILRKHAIVVEQSCENMQK